MELDEIKKLREEIKEEILKDLKDEKRGRVAWNNFKNKELLPFLQRKFDIYKCHKIVEALSVFNRCRHGVKSISYISIEDMDTVKEDTYKLLEYWFNLKRDNI